MDQPSAQIEKSVLGLSNEDAGSMSSFSLLRAESWPTLEESRALFLKECADNMPDPSVTGAEPLSSLQERSEFARKGHASLAPVTQPQAPPINQQPPINSHTEGIFKEERVRKGLENYLTEASMTELIEHLDVEHITAEINKLSEATIPNVWPILAISLYHGIEVYQSIKPWTFYSEWQYREVAFRMIAGVSNPCLAPASSAHKQLPDNRIRTFPESTEKQKSGEPRRTTPALCRHVLTKYSDNDDMIVFRDLDEQVTYRTRISNFRYDQLAGIRDSIRKSLKVLAAYLVAESKLARHTI